MFSFLAYDNKEILGFRTKVICNPYDFISAIEIYGLVCSIPWVTVYWIVTIPLLLHDIYQTHELTLLK